MDFHHLRLALHQTVLSTINLFTYLLHEKEGINFILLGLIQQNCLEGGFGWWRQLSGGNYYNSVLQFLQAEKTIRLCCLVKSGYQLKEIKGMFDIVKSMKNLLVQEYAVEFSDNLSEFKFTKSTSDIPITYYVAGYISKILFKKIEMLFVYVNGF